LLEKTMEKPIEIAGIPIDPITYEEALGLVGQSVESGRQAHWVTVNPEMILYASRHPDFLKVLQNAQIRTPDGMGILWAAHFLGRPVSRFRPLAFLQWFVSLASIPFITLWRSKPISERVTGTDLMRKIVDASQQKEWPLFLLGLSGETSGMAEQAIQRLSGFYPRARFVGSFACPPQDDSEPLRRINLAQPKILFVAFGSPAQEFWIRRNLPLIPSVKLAIGVGGAFDFHAGRIARAPQWMQKAGIEWLWRLARQPRRLFRILNATVRFPLLVLRKRFEHD
jgi:N-acetylglucosaminyldiphosphoundecaprenol N-acetyl-beta-D-mannosaminyltransferase